MQNRSYIINQIADIIGYADADKIADTFAGGCLYITTASRSRLVQCVGIDNAKLLVQHMGRGSVNIPLGDRKTFANKRQQFYKMITDGYTVAHAGRTCGIAQRTATYWKRDYDMEYNR